METHIKKDRGWYLPIVFTCAALIGIAACMYGDYHKAHSGDGGELAYCNLLALSGGSVSGFLYISIIWSLPVCAMAFRKRLTRRALIADIASIMLLTAATHYLIKHTDCRPTALAQSFEFLVPDVITSPEKN